MSFWSCLKKLFGSGLSLPDPPDLPYFRWLARQPYVKGIQDCSNKATAYLYRLQELNIPCDYFSVRLRATNENHAVVRAIINDVSVWLDPTLNDWGWWQNQTQFSVNGIRLPNDGLAEFWTTGLLHDDFTAEKQLAAATLAKRRQEAGNA